MKVLQDALIQSQRDQVNLEKLQQSLEQEERYWSGSAQGTAAFGTKRKSEDVPEP